jgi:hypothetical protein
MIDLDLGRKKRQQITCECGRVHILQEFEETTWTLYRVYDDYCGEYGLLSKFPASPGKPCPRCNRHKLMVMAKLPDTEETHRFLINQHLEIWRFVKDGEVIKVD